MDLPHKIIRNPGGWWDIWVKIGTDWTLYAQVSGNKSDAQRTAWHITHKEG